MAIRQRKGRSKAWECYWRNPVTGKQESACFETKEEAKKQDSLVKHRIRFERESFQEEEPDNKGEMTLDQAYLAYLREKQFSQKGLNWQLDCMRLALEHLGSMPLSSLTLEQLKNIMAAHAAKGVKSITVRTRMSVLRAVLRWSAEQGYCEMPRFPRLPKVEYERFIPPTPEELAAIMKVAAPHIQRVIILGSQLGARIGPCELFQLTWVNVDLVQGLVRVMGSRKNINAPWREVPIREALIPIMTQWAMDDKAAGVPYLIHFRGKPVATIKRAWKATLRRAGITRRIRPYDLRHAFATELIAAGADIGTVAKLMGHSSPTMILNHYQFVMDKQKRAVIESLPDMPCMASLYGHEKRQSDENA